VGHGLILHIFFLLVLKFNNKFLGFAVVRCLSPMVAMHWNPSLNHSKQSALEAGFPQTIRPGWLSCTPEAPVALVAIFQANKTLCVRDSLFIHDKLTTKYAGNKIVIMQAGVLSTGLLLQAQLPPNPAQRRSLQKEHCPSTCLFCPPAYACMHVY
jgi:hypothetical protein